MIGEANILMRNFMFMLNKSCTLKRHSDIILYYSIHIIYIYMYYKKNYNNENKKLIK